METKRIFMTNMAARKDELLETEILLIFMTNTAEALAELLSITTVRSTTMTNMVAIKVGLISKCNENLTQQVLTTTCCFLILPYANMTHRGMNAF